MIMKVLMVCLGNICRSPLAQGILEAKVNNLNLDWEVDSAGTAGYHQGNPADSRSIATAAENGIDITHQRSRKFIARDLDYFDLILAMDASNYNHMMQMATEDDQRDKIKLILNYSHPGENRQVPDPYYHGGFDKVYEMLDAACDKIIDLAS